MPFLHFVTAEPLRVVRRAPWGGRLAVLGACLSAACAAREPAAPPEGVVATLLALATVSGGGEGKAEIGAFHPASARLFVANGVDRRVEVLDLSDPRAPRAAGPLDVARHFAGGSPNSVALHRDLLAVAVQAHPPQAAGVVQFWDVRRGAFLKQVKVGALPDMVVFDARGRRCLVANEGEPDDDYAVDPPGSITLIALPAGGPAELRASDVRTIGFTEFDDRAEELARAGVRLLGPGASVSEDLEPEFIALAPDGSRAWVTCQENNALAVLDLEQERVVELVALGEKDWGSADLVHGADLAWLDWPELPFLDPARARIRLGGFSGLAYAGPGERPGVARLMAVSDRGPTLGKFDLEGESCRVLALPDYQPRVLLFDLVPGLSQVRLAGTLALCRADGAPLGGRPNLAATAPGLAYHDERTVDSSHRPLDLDPLGVDLEGIACAADGSLWLCDEYRPSLLHFDAQGRMLARYVPHGSNGHGAVVGTELLPRRYASRRFNRGFEAIAIDASTGHVYTWLQSPLDNPDGADDRASRAARNARVLAFDPASEALVGEYVYALDGGQSDKVCAATWSGTAGEFLVLERDARAGRHALKNVYRVALDQATNLLELGEDYERLAGADGRLEATSPERLSRLEPPIAALRKTLYLNLVDAGYTQLARPEGLARLLDGRLLIANDDDFDLGGEREPGRLALVTPLPAGLDLAGADGALRLDPWPVRSLYQPDAILAFEQGGETWLALANEGEHRNYEGEPGFSDAAPVASLPLDARLAARLASSSGALDRLIVARPGSPGADPDGDGDLDALLTFGARSFSIRTPDGSLVFDSGAGLTRRALAAAPGRLAGTSDSKGVEPESLALGSIDGRRYLFVGLEGFGAVAVYGLENPRAPTFAGFVDAPGQHDPEGLCFVSADDSPSGKPLLILCHADSGTVSIHELQL